MKNNMNIENVDLYTLRNHVSNLDTIISRLNTIISEDLVTNIRECQLRLERLEKVRSNLEFIERQVLLFDELCNY